MTKGGDTLGYGTYEARFKILNTNCRGPNSGVYVGMGLWNFNGPTQQEVMMGFFNESPTNDDFQILTTKNRARGGASDPTNKYHSKIVDESVTFSSFSTFRTIKFVYEQGKVTGYLDNKLVLTKTDIIPTEKMTLVIGCRVTGTGSLSNDLKVVWDYVKIDSISPPPPTPTLSSINISGCTSEIKNIGDRCIITEVCKNTNNETITCPTLTYINSNPSVLEVINGVITAKSEGTSTVKVTSNNIVSNELQFTVSKQGTCTPPICSFTVSQL